MSKNLAIQTDKVLEETGDLFLLIRKLLAQSRGVIIDVCGNLYFAVRKGEIVHGIKMDEGKIHAEARKDLSDDSVAPAGPNVMYRGVEGVTLARKSGAAPARQVMMIQQQHALACARQKSGAYHAADARADDDHVVVAAQVGFVDRDHIQIIRLLKSLLLRCARSRRER